MILKFKRSCSVLNAYYEITFQSYLNFEFCKRKIRGHKKIFMNWNFNKQCLKMIYSYMSRKGVFYIFQSPYRLWSHFKRSLNFSTNWKIQDFTAHSPPFQLRKKRAEFCEPLAAFPSQIFIHNTSTIREKKREKLILRTPE